MVTRSYPEHARRETQKDRRQLVGMAVVIVLALIVGTVWQATRSSASVRDPFAHFNDTWTPVPAEIADTLAESGLPHADTRPWENCAIHWGRTTTRIICPDGFTTRY